jgi:DnaK suppressor protein
MTELRPNKTTSDQKGTGMKAEVFLPDDYIPAEDEPFMNERQLEWFRRELIRQKNELLSESRTTIAGLQDGTRNIPDIADRASEETDRALELRIRDRQRKLVAKIDSALRRIEEGEFGYCRRRASRSRSSASSRGRRPR